MAAAAPPSERTETAEGQTSSDWPVLPSTDPASSGRSAVGTAAGRAQAGHSGCAFFCGASLPGVGQRFPNGKIPINLETYESEVAFKRMHMMHQAASCFHTCNLSTDLPNDTISVSI